MLGEKAQQDSREGIFEGYGGDTQSIRSYATLAGLFNFMFAAFLLVARRTDKDIPERMDTKDLVMLGITAHKLSDVGANDAVMTPLRAPFTELKEKESPKSVDETPRGRGLQKSIGELLTCQFCLGMWISAILTYAFVLAPRATRLVASIFTIVTISDHLHQTYKALKTRA